jgi:hypothetical protein
VDEIDLFAVLKRFDNQILKASWAEWAQRSDQPVPMAKPISEKYDYSQTAPSEWRSQFVEAPQAG